MKNSYNLSNNCPLCTLQKSKLLFETAGRLYFRCKCGFLYSKNAIDGRSEMPELYAESYYRHWGISGDRDTPANIGKRATFSSWISAIERHSLPQKNLLDIGCGTGAFCTIARERNWKVSGIELSSYAAHITRKQTDLQIYNGTIADVPATAGPFTIITAFDVLEHISGPDLFIAAIARLLPSGGICAISTPDISSISCRLLGKYWFQFKPEHCSYFSKEMLSRLFLKYGFDIVALTTARKKITPMYLCRYGEKYAPQKLRACFSRLGSMIPQSLANHPVHLPTGEVFLLARKVQ